MVLPRLTVLEQRYAIGGILEPLSPYTLVYKAWNLRTEEQVLLQEYLPEPLARRASDGLGVLPREAALDEIFHYGYEQFLKEAAVWAELAHPNLTPQVEVFEANGTVYQVLQHHAGASLEAVLAKHGGRLPVQTAVTILVPILDGLHAAHQHGLLHAAVTPHSVFLSKGQGPLLRGFRTAALMLALRSGRLGDVLEPGYAAPEQYDLEGCQGPWSDVYGCAAMLVHILTGEAPPEAPQRQAHDDLADRLHAADLSENLREVLEAALTLSPEARLRSVQAFRQLLHEAATSKPATPAAIAPRESAADDSVGEESITEEIVAGEPPEGIALEESSADEPAPAELSEEEPSTEGGFSDDASALEEDIVAAEEPAAEGASALDAEVAHAEVDEPPFDVEEPLFDVEAPSPPEAEHTETPVAAPELPEPPAPQVFEEDFSFADFDTEYPEDEHEESDTFSPQHDFASLYGDAEEEEAPVLSFTGELGEWLREESDPPGDASPTDAFAFEEDLTAHAPSGPLEHDFGAPVDAHFPEALAEAPEPAEQADAPDARPEAPLPEVPLPEVPLPEVRLPEKPAPKTKPAPAKAAEPTPSRRSRFAWRPSTPVLAALAAAMMLALAAAFLLIRNADSGQTQYAHFRAQADSLFAAANYADARIEYERALAAAPDDGYAADRLAETQRLLSDVGAARYAENLARGDALLARADSLLGTGDPLEALGVYSEANQAYYEALRYRPGDPLVLEKGFRTAQGMKQALTAHEQQIGRHIETAATEEPKVRQALAQNPEAVRVVASVEETAPVLMADAAQEEAAQEETAQEEAAQEEQVYVVVEEAPRLVGGLKGLYEQIRMPQEAVAAGISGRVHVQFIVDQEGRVQSPKVVRGLGAGCDEEALRVIQSARFEPGKIGGRPVSVRHTLAVAFRGDQS